MKIGIPKECAPGETRVAVIPASMAGLIKKGHAFLVESGAGVASHYLDEQYKAAGAAIVGSARELFGEVDAVLKVQSPKGKDGKNGNDGKNGDGNDQGDWADRIAINELELMRDGQILISYLSPFAHPEVVRDLAKRGVTSFSMEYIPRITRAQSMDALSSMATLAGYKAVVMAADRLGKILPLMMTAAGSIAPATVLVLGAGVAGLQAIATAKRLGAKVEAFDPRPVVKEQVESVGAIFIPMEVLEDVQTAGGYAKEQSEEFLRRERDAIGARLGKADIVVTTAQIFGKPAPLLITEEMVRLMQPGSVIVDLAAEQGGNCALTEADREVVEAGVIILGPTNLPATVPVHASQMYSKNVTTLFDHLFGGEGGKLDFEDEITKGACMTYGGEIRIEAVRKMVEGK